LALLSHDSCLTSRSSGQYLFVPMIQSRLPFSGMDWKGRSRTFGPTVCLITYWTYTWQISSRGCKAKSAILCVAKLRWTIVKNRRIGLVNAYIGSAKLSCETKSCSNPFLRLDSEFWVSFRRVAQGKVCVVGLTFNSSKARKDLLKYYNHNSVRTVPSWITPDIFHVPVLQGDSYDNTSETLCSFYWWV
jgi:hypothetical protein